MANDGDWITLKGKVIDAKNQSVLIGAKITFGDSNIVAYTDPDGNFDIDVPTEKLKEIKIEYISYVTTVFSCNQETGEIVFQLPSR